MKIVVMGLMCCLAAFGAGKGGQGGGGGGCTNTGLVWQISSSPHPVDGSASAIEADALGDYVNGERGVVSYIDNCSQSNDARVALTDTSLRNVTVDFRNRLSPLTNLTPIQVQNGLVSCMNICWLFMIKNLTYVPAGKSPTDPFTFSTHLTGGGPLNSHLQMMSDFADAALPSTDPAVGDPYPNSLVWVTHCPAGNTTYAPCTGNPKEQWHVWSDAQATTGSTHTGLPATHVVSLVIDATKGKNGHPGGSGGEFSVPFYFVLTAQ